MGRLVIDITGQKFWRLTALSYQWKSKRLWKCDCGNQKVIVKNSVVRQNGDRTILSCWCLYRESWPTRKSYVHWLTRTHFYRKRDGMQWRCYRPNHKKFELWWWKWIQVLWKDFKEFRDDMHDSYLEHVAIHWERNTTIDRIDSEWNYCKDNCRRATYQVQNNHLNYGQRVAENNYGPIPVSYNPVQR